MQTPQAFCRRPRVATSRAGFTLVEMLIVIVIISILAALLLPAVQASREAARRSLCVSREKQIALAIMNFENNKRRYPTAMTTDVTGTPGAPAAAEPGFSWIVQILPYLEETSTYENIRNHSDRLALPAWTSTITNTSSATPGIGDTASPATHMSSFDISFLRCPSYRASNIAGPNYPSATPPFSNSNGHAKVGNYVAIISTHVNALGTNGATLPSTSLPNFPYDNFGNAAIVPPQENGLGLTLRDITDGTSKTVLFCESREEELGSWYDGASAWVVAADPNNPSDPGIVNGYIGLSVDPGNRVALNVGPTSPTVPLHYLPAAKWDANIDRKWGPSSFHTGMVVHGFADGHVRVFTDDVDADVYLRMVTRAGGEAINEDEI